MNVIITSPSLDPRENVSGISSVTRFIIDNNRAANYLHFLLGKKDREKGGLRRVLALWHSYRAWKHMLSDNTDALIHYNLPLSRASLLRDPWFMRYALRRGHKMVVHMHGGLFLTAPHIPFYLGPILRWVFSQRVPFIALSDMEKDILTARWGAKTVVSLPNCVDLHDAQAFAEEKRSCDDTRPLHLGYLGRIEPNKGMNELLTACRQLKQKGCPFLLMMAGKEQTEGEYLPRFERELKDSFRYVGLVSGPTKCQFLRSLDVLVMPTYFEGLPMSLLECMSYGAVPVVSPVGSIPQVVTDGVNGLLIHTHDSDSIVEAVRRLNEDRTLLKTLGHAARQTIFSQYNPLRYVDELNQIYTLTLQDDECTQSKPSLTPEDTHR